MISECKNDHVDKIIVIMKNRSDSPLLDLTADFGVVKTNAELTQIFKLREKSKN